MRCSSLPRRIALLAGSARLDPYSLTRPRIAGSDRASDSKHGVEFRQASTRLVQVKSWPLRPRRNPSGSLPGMIAYLKCLKGEC